MSQNTQQLLRHYIKEYGLVDANVMSLPDGERGFLAMVEDDVEGCFAQGPTREGALEAAVEKLTRP